MPEITAFLIVRNEESLLPRCLDSLRKAVDGIVVLDTGSEDDTLEVLAKYAGRADFPPLQWREQPFEDFGSTRQAALDLVRSEWAFWIDADEEISPALGQRICDLKIQANLADHDVWEIKRVNRVLGRQMRAKNLAGDYVQRLFRTGCARISRSLVHEGLELEQGCTIGRLDEPLLHDSMTSWRAYLAKVNLYTSLDAARSERAFNPLHLLIAPTAAFYRHYLARGGFRDGWPGFVWAITSAWSQFLRDWKLLRRALGLKP